MLREARTVKGTQPHSTYARVAQRPGDPVRTLDFERAIPLLEEAPKEKADG